ncbi:MAG: 4-hydroxybutyryl-CoA dehydratase, partial [Deltaproteobacteria bacterium]|nr:4-hydroxybutyryl-CoA dehydratase [Deltaproteobacteria bacterium]
MTLRTADEYKEGLKDGRTAYMLGKKIPDVTEDPYLKVGVETGAQDFVMADEPEYRDLSVIQDPETGEDISRFFELPDYKEQIRKRFELVLAGGRYDSGEFIPYIKDVGTDALNALYVVSNMMGDKKYIERIRNYRNMCARKDLSMALAMTDVNGDRSKGPLGQAHKDYYVHVVEENKDEIVVKGAKA